MITTVNQKRRTGGIEEQISPRQQRHCVKHSCHSDWRASPCRNELPQCVLRCNGEIKFDVNVTEDSWSSSCVCEWAATRADCFHCTGYLQHFCCALKPYHILVLYTETCLLLFAPCVIMLALYWAVSMCLCHDRAFVLCFESNTNRVDCNFNSKNKVSSVSIVVNNTRSMSLPVHLSCFCQPCVLRFKKKLEMINAAKKLFLPKTVKAINDHWWERTDSGSY